MIIHLPPASRHNKTRQNSTFNGLIHKTQNIKPVKAEGTKNFPSVLVDIIMIVANYLFVMNTTFGRLDAMAALLYM